MTKNPNIERAAKVLGECLPILRDHANHSLEHSATALATAGLLVTPLHERALEACEALAKYYTHDFGIADYRPFGAACKVGRESLALKEKAKVVKWSVEKAPYGSNGYVVSLFPNPGNYANTVYKPGDDEFTKAEADKVAAALNEGDES